MSSSAPTDAESFYNFLSNSLGQGDREPPPVARAARVRGDVRRIQEGFEQMEAGQFMTLEDFDREFRQRNSLPPRNAT